MRKQGKSGNNFQISATETIITSALAGNQVTRKPIHNPKKHPPLRRDFFSSLQKERGETRRDDLKPAQPLPLSQR